MDEEEYSVDDVEVVPTTQSQTEGMAEQLEKQIQAAKDLAESSTKASVAQEFNDAFAIVKREWSLFAATGRRTEILQRNFAAINGTKPTSVDIERAFSACGMICTKEKGHMKDSTLHAVTFLRSYFN